MVLNANDSEKTLNTRSFSQVLKSFTKGTEVITNQSMAIGFGFKNFAMDSAYYGVGMTRTIE